MPSVTRVAVVVLTPRGRRHATLLREGLIGDVDVFAPSCVVGDCRPFAVNAGHSLPDDPRERRFPTVETGLFGWVGPLRAVLPTLWSDYDALVMIMAAGIVTRLVGPLASDKRRDPAVIVVDEAARFAIPVLGGHEAGANALPARVATLLDATPVITTASDARGLPAVDQIGANLGWTIASREHLTRAAAAVVRGQTVAVVQDAGEADWWTPFGSWPDHFQPCRDASELLAADPAAVLIISDRITPEFATTPGVPTVVYRPRSLIAGIGCRRGTSAEAIAGFVSHVFAKHGLATASLAAIATVTLKADEPGLIAYAHDLGIPLLAYAPDVLDGLAGIETPSARVLSKIGIAAVAEPAALHAAAASKLLVTKQIGPGITVAAARRSEFSRFDRRHQPT